MGREDGPRRTANWMIERQRLYREDEVDALLTLHPGGEPRVHEAREAETDRKAEPETATETEGDLPRADGWIGEM